MGFLLDGFNGLVQMAVLELLPAATQTRIIATDPWSLLFQDRLVLLASQVFLTLLGSQRATLLA